MIVKKYQNNERVVGPRIITIAMTNKVPYYTPPIPEILCVKNVRAIVVCGFLIN